ncbi:MAG: hypothetical protein ACLQD8_01865 [Thermoplasmata archaeon]
MPTPRSSLHPPRVPEGFRVAREMPVGRHPLLAVFPGLDQLAPAIRLEADPERRARLFDGTCVEVVDQDLWMYVAPWEAPKGARRQWKPVMTPGRDCVVIGQAHLRESPELVLFMDVYHELCHVVQRRDGANLWEPGVSYVERWTEIEAYRFVVREARDLGVDDAFLREYLKVEWISETEHKALLGQVGVSVG